MFLQNSEMEQDLLFFLIGLLSFLLNLYLIFLYGYGIMVLEIGRDRLPDKPVTVCQAFLEKIEKKFCSTKGHNDKADKKKIFRLASDI